MSTKKNHQSVKIGVLGCADIASRFILSERNASDKFNLKGVASRSKEKANNFSKRFNTTPYYGYEDIISSDIEAVYIPLPNSLHFKWVKKSLNAGLHVLVEK